MTTITVGLGHRSYPVIVGAGASRDLPSLVPGGARRAAIVTQASIPLNVDPGVEHMTFAIGDGEAAKSLATVEDLCRRFVEWGLTRSDVVVAVGGGVVTDTAGFAAAVYLRGVAVVNVATSLLAMVDAAVGGKTGVNLPEGKNLVGAFWQPIGVICELSALATLPVREHRSGLGEMAKYHFLTREDLDGLDLESRIAACVALKGEVVSGDERETGGRALLNYGHTLAHAIETLGSYDLRHGEAVAIGLVFAAELAQVLGRIDSARVEEHRRVVAKYDLPQRLPEGMEPARLVALMHRDKKATSGLTFVLDGPVGLEVVAGVDEHSVLEALAYVGAQQ